METSIRSFDVRGDRDGLVTGGADLTALDVDRVHAEPSTVPVQIFDLDGALLAEAAAPTTRESAAPSDTDAPVLSLLGRERAGFGPTSVPTLARLGRAAVAENGKRDVAVQLPEEGAPDDPAPVDPENVDPESFDDAPSGSALSTLDAVALFGEAARGQFAGRDC
ncbi:MAG: hypothetical protein GEU83_01110 [Pseudonocardiaceae bacterium]|nr:hypothetical protein [Pseudonocardiaceae bacterium]